ncbi:MAG: helix-turn-helix transcriptional regulator [Actinobacteria bacterium]|nr:helix-turn-helix transcriptional regulator [Actinomycetota bacterium]
MVSSTTKEATLAKAEELARAGLPAQRFLEATREIVAGAVPSDTFFYAATDPGSGLAMGAGTTTLPHEICSTFWDHEFFVPDYTKFAELADGRRHVADLHAATGGRPERSPRWREFAGLLGIDAELRATLTDGGLTWGIVQLNRTTGASAFDGDELDLVDSLLPHLARGLRAALTSEPAAGAVADRGPGMAIVDRDGELVSMTGEAEAWFADLATVDLGERARGPEPPYEISQLAISARRRHELGERPPRMRMRTIGGMWLLAHASVLGDSDQVALVIEPAKASEVAPLIVEAYGLTPRELEVTRMIARGTKTSEMAAQLFLSPHTVRDHIKAIFEKVGVSSRGELTATLFADHYHPGLDQAFRAGASA